MPKSTARGMRRSTSVITMDIPDGQEGEELFLLYLYWRRMLPAPTNLIIFYSACHHSLFSLPTSTATRSPVSLCSFTSWILSFSPGAVALLMTVRAFTWVTERTVAAVSHGRPKRGQMAPRITMSKRSRWNPEPLTSRRSFLLTINLMEEREGGVVC